MEYYSVLKNEGNSGICNERNGIRDHNVKWNKPIFKRIIDLNME